MRLAIAFLAFALVRGDARGCAAINELIGLEEDYTPVCMAMRNAPRPSHDPTTADALDVLMYTPTALQNDNPPAVTLDAAYNRIVEIIRAHDATIFTSDAKPAQGLWRWKNTPQYCELAGAILSAMDDVALTEAMGLPGKTAVELATMHCGPQLEMLLTRASVAELDLCARDLLGSNVTADTQTLYQRLVEKTTTEQLAIAARIPVTADWRRDAIVNELRSRGRTADVANMNWDYAQYVDELQRLNALQPRVPIDQPVAYMGIPEILATARPFTPLHVDMIDLLLAGNNAYCAKNSQWVAERALAEGNMPMLHRHALHLVRHGAVYELLDLAGLLRHATAAIDPRWPGARSGDTLARDILRIAIEPFPQILPEIANPATLWHDFYNALVRENNAAVQSGAAVIDTDAVWAALISRRPEIAQITPVPNGTQQQ